MPDMLNSRKKDSGKSKNGVITVTTKILRIKMKGADKYTNYLSTDWYEVKISNDVADVIILKILKTKTTPRKILD